MTTAIALYLVGVVMASSGQMLLKLGALRARDRSIARSLLDPFTIAGYALMFASTITSTIAMKTLPLHYSVALLPLGYIVVVCLSVTVLGERMRRHHLIGMLMILSGVAIFNLGML